jgi:hypothetical protein
MKFSHEFFREFVIVEENTEKSYSKDLELERNE